ncbi:MAG: CDP-alcohol phosphatidyltransferase family protein [Bacteroidetes bacterium]|nr:CDP-alcohol phosphatidyltransferase family protein [Bacteroidota bacterium]
MKKNIPNFFTLCNLFCGCIAIVFAFEGNLIWSAYMVGIACLFDFLDGMAARALKVNSEIGKQLDSLADMVSFGVVPGVIVFILLNHSMVTCGADVFVAAPISFCGFLITIFSAIRLAKFNLDTRQSDMFIGLPTPANTIFISSLPVVLQFNLISESMKQIITNPYFLISLSLISSFLLIAPISLFAFKFKNFSWADNKVRYIFLTLAFVLLIILKFAGIPLIIILYIVLSVINNLVSKKKLGK